MLISPQPSLDTSDGQVLVVLMIVANDDLMASAQRPHPKYFGLDSCVIANRANSAV